MDIFGKWRKELTKKLKKLASPHANQGSAHLMEEIMMLEREITF